MSVGCPGVILNVFFFIIIIHGIGDMVKYGDIGK